MAENFDDEKVVSLVTKLFSKNVFYVQVAEGHPIYRPIEFSTYFSGKTADMWLVLIFSLEGNFDDVLKKF